jgi:Na+/proline symporter
VAIFGTDQDMVQRLLTAETYKKSRRSLITAAVMDLPIFATFTFIGILLIVYYKQDPTYKPKANADVFASYILNVMPVGVRGLVLAGVFATAMGSLSAALNALATSLTNDWYIPYVARGRSEAHHVAAARWFTALFAVLMIVIAGAFAYAKVHLPDLRIIPVVLGVAGFIVGPMLGVFLVGMFTKRRGSDVGNVIAITCGLAATIVLGGLHVEVANLLAGREVWRVPGWLPRVAFTWFALIGAVVVFCVAVLFRTPEGVVARAEERAMEAEGSEGVPVAMRG